MSWRNPIWNRDELILAMDFYLRHAPQIPNKGSAEIADLSEQLKCLQRRLGGDRTATFRNANGVYMKLMNFRRFDPSYEGKGLQRGNKDEEVVWKLFADRPDELRKIADAIRDYTSADTYIPSADVIADNEVESDEGTILTRTHRYRERDASLVRKKKLSVQKAVGALSCEACGFEFVKRYGDHGDGFIECHHTKPLSELASGEKTRLSDLALVCSNCHRMIHRKRPWLSLDDLRSLLRSQN